jgi:hypothetical protein
MNESKRLIGTVYGDVPPALTLSPPTITGLSAL